MATCLSSESVIRRAVQMLWLRRPVSRARTEDRTDDEAKGRGRQKMKQTSTNTHLTCRYTIGREEGCL